MIITPDFYLLFAPCQSKDNPKNYVYKTLKAFDKRTNKQAILYTGLVGALTLNLVSIISKYI
jgi:hypothetical protein